MFNFYTDVAEKLLPIKLIGNFPIHSHRAQFMGLLNLCDCVVSGMQCEKSTSFVVSVI